MIQEDTLDTLGTLDTLDTLGTSQDILSSQDILTHIDLCVSDSTDYDIACVVHKCLKDSHRYVKDNIWEYLKSSEWVVDKNAKEFNAFTKRSLYWGDIKECDKYQDTEVISIKLLQISSKLKDNKYISILIKECKLFFAI